MSNAAIFVWGFIALVGLVGVVGIYRNVMQKSRPPQPRGRAPGQGDTVVSADLGSGVGGHSTVYRVPKDDQQYAKGMMPGNRK